MITPLRTEGIVLTRREYRESDTIITVYTRHYGKVSGIAFGAKRSRKRFVNCLDLFALSWFFLTQRTHQELTKVESCELIRGRYRLSEDLRALGTASYLAEITASLTAEWDKNPELFELLAQCMDYLEGAIQPEAVARIFEVRILSHLGYRINLKACSGCLTPHGQKGSVYFQPDEGSIRCEICAVDRNFPLSEGTIKTLDFIQNEPLETTTRLRISHRAEKEAKVALQAFLKHLMKKRSKSLEFIERISGIDK